jgi:diacylglycerol O-acyltransferase / wax synthase
MSEIHNCDSLNFGDALFLHLERHGSPLHVAAVCIFEGEIGIEEFATHIESRLPFIPRYLQRVLPAPLGLGMPMWEFDPNFDIHNHVREIALKRGTENELQKEVSHVLSHRLHRERPLWEFILFTGLRGTSTEGSGKKRCALLARVHHALADGISGVSMLNVITDSEPVPRKSSKPQPRPDVTPRDPATHLMDSLVTSWFSILERVLTVESQLLRMAQDMVTKAANGVKGNAQFVQDVTPADVTDLLPEFGAPPDRLPFNVVCRGPQSFEWTELPFEDIRAIKRVCNATVNDAMLTLIAMTIRRYAQARGAATDNRIVRIVLPVNVRTAEQTGGLGNQITFVPVTIPIGIADPKELLYAVHVRTDAVKKLRLAEMVSFGGTLLGTIPTAFQIFAAPIVSQLPLPLLNFICTNVPGPQRPLYILGRKMLTCYPYVPIGGEMGMNCAILTYNGKAFVGFTCDIPATPDSKLLPKFLQESFVELKEAVGIKTVRKVKRRAPKAVPAVKAAAAAPPLEPKSVQTAEPERAMAQVASD